jgi:hypothetical protein
MKISELVFVGIKGTVVALDRVTGQQVWVAHLKGMDFVNVVVDEGKILATVRGEIFCLEPATGQIVWHNRLKGFGLGLASIATERTSQNSMTAALAGKRRQDEEAAAAASASAIM